jgi:hypothetical protein
MLKKHLNKYVTASKVNDYPFSGLNRAKSLNPPSSYDDMPVSGRKEMSYRLNS